MTMRKVFGSDMSKWYISKGRLGWWWVSEPHAPNRVAESYRFATGAEALAAFAAGGAK